MARVTGIVTAVEAGVVRIECSPDTAPACAACASGRGCGWQRSAAARRIDLPVTQAGMPFGQGDRLELEVDEARLLRAAGRLYLPPLFGVLAAPALLRLAGMEQGAWPLLAAAAGLLAGGCVAWRWTRAAVPVRWRRADPAVPDAAG